MNRTNLISALWRMLQSSIYKGCLDTGFRWYDDIEVKGTAVRIN